MASHWQQDLFISSIVAALVTLFVWIAAGKPPKNDRNRSSGSAGPNYALVFVVVLMLAYVLFFVMCVPAQDSNKDDGSLERALQHVLRSQDLDF
jgi:hypothetical protein